MINSYLAVRYVDGARGPDAYDCWGLVRHVRHYEMGFKLLPSFGTLRNTQPKEFTKAYRQESMQLTPCEPKHGAIAAVMIGAICVHVALVVESDDRLCILEINPERGPRFMPLHTWLRDHNKVTFHHD